MNGVEKITARIDQYASADVAVIAKDAEEKAAAIRAKYQAEADDAAKKAEDAGAKAAAQRLERLEGAAKMDAKKMILSAKQDCLDQAFAKAHKALLALPEEKYVDLLARMAVKASSTGREELLLNSRDQKKVGAEVVKKANALKKGVELTLSKDTRDMEGGLTLRDGNVEVNCSFETQLRILREDMAAELAGILFS